MKLCFIATKSGEFGGSEILWYMVAKEALDNGSEVLVSIHKSYLEHEQIELLQKLGAKLHIRRNNQLQSLLGRVIFKLKQAIPYYNSYKEIEKFSPDLVVLSHGGTYDAAGQALLYLFLKRTKLPFILISQFHRENKILPEIIASRARVLFAKAEKVLFVSKNNLLASEKTLGVKIYNGQVINNPIKLNTKLLDWPVGDYLSVACVARLNFNIKRQDLLIKVFSKEKWIARKIILNLYGDGPDRDALINLIEKLNLVNKIKIHGHVKDVQRIWEQNHIFILPSIAEGLPLSLIEANLLARPAITTRVGDNERLVIPGKTGFLINDLTEEALDEALENAWQQKKELIHLGKAARQHAMQKIDVDIHKTLYKLFSGYVRK